MSLGRCLAVAIAMLGSGQWASGAGRVPAAPDAIADQVRACLHERYADHDRLAMVDRVFGIEQRIGAYRAARTQAELMARLNADLWVATADGRVHVATVGMPSDARSEHHGVGAGLELVVPGGQ